MIKTFRHKGIQKFFESGSKAGIQPQHAAKLSRQLAKLHGATGPDDMNIPGWQLHPLKSDLAGHYSVWVNGNLAADVRIRGSGRGAGGLSGLSLRASR
jgi:proteic killer suppression protein